MADGQSPVITKKPEIVDFPVALRAVAQGKRITRIEWKNEKIYGHLLSGTLMIHKEDGDHTWVVSEGDILANDWRIMEAES